MHEGDTWRNEQRFAGSKELHQTRQDPTDPSSKGTGADTDRVTAAAGAVHLDKT